MPRTIPLLQSRLVVVAREWVSADISRDLSHVPPSTFLMYRLLLSCIVVIGVALGSVSTHAETAAPDQPAQIQDDRVPNALDAIRIGIKNLTTVIEKSLSPSAQQENRSARNLHA